MTLNELKTILLEIPDRELDVSAKKTINSWEEFPTALRLLELLDNIVRYSLSCDLVVQFLDMRLKIALQEENMTMEELENQAVWRNE